MVEFILILTLLSAVLVLYHHILYPALLKKLASGRHDLAPPIPSRRFKRTDADELRPTITMVMPAYNEAQFIAEKLRNLACLDYPKDKLIVELHCDGCTDGTASIARRVLQEPECRWLNATVFDHQKNRGKLSVLNESVVLVSTELVVLSDVSALLPIDALLAVVEHFKCDDVGAVSGGYRVLTPSSEGEATYWRYQREIKCRESALGSVLGGHGAFYVFRRALFNRIDPGTINDDFVLPMTIAAQGYKVIYEPRVTSLELEQADAQLESKRRKRIAAGNMQQLLTFLYLLKPRYGWLAFNFASGKALRAVMPFCLLILLIGSVYLAPFSLFFLGLGVAQLMVYGLVLTLGGLKIESQFDVLRIMQYLVCGHWAGLIGASRYLLGLERGHWK